MDNRLLLLMFVLVIAILFIVASKKGVRENADGSVAMSTAATTWFNGNVDDLVTKGAFTGNLYGPEGVASEYIIA